MNVPYKKIYENGILANPIDGKYESSFPSRRQRRKKEPRLFNNANSFPTKIVRYELPKETGNGVDVKFDKYHPKQQLLTGNFKRRGVAKKHATIVHY